MRKQNIIDIGTINLSLFQVEREFVGSYGNGESKGISALVSVGDDWKGKVTFIVAAFGEEKHRGDNLREAIEVYNSIPGREA